MSYSPNDIVNQYRNGGTGASNAKQVADYYNQQIASIQSGVVQLQNTKNAYNPQDAYNQSTVNLYQSSMNKANQLTSDYQKALEQQSLNKQYAQKYLGTQLASQGLSQVGTSETSANAIASQYGQNIANLSSAYSKGMTDIESERLQAQQELDTNFQAQMKEQESETVSNYISSLNNVSNFQDLDRIKKMYGNVENTELNNALYYKEQELYEAEVANKINEAIDIGQNSREQLENILKDYKNVLNETTYNTLENEINNIAVTGEISAYSSDKNPISIDAYTSATDLTAKLNVKQGKEQTEYIAKILNDLKAGRISNGSFVQLNYGKKDKKYDNIYYVYNNKLYKVDETKAEAGNVINSIYIPYGYKKDLGSFFKGTKSINQIVKNDKLLP